MTPPTRVLILEPAGELWGSERALLDLLSHLDRGRFKVAVACPPSGPLVSELEQMKVRVLPVSTSNLHRKSRLRRLAALFSLFRAALQFKPHVIHVNQAGVMMLAALVGRALSIPVICHVRMHQDAIYLRQRIPSWLQPRILVAISNYVRAALGEGARIHRVYDPFPIPVSSPHDVAARKHDASRVREELGLGPDDRLVAFVGRVCLDKGVDTFVAAAMLVADVEPRAKFLVIGEEIPDTGGDRPLLAHLRALAAGQGHAGSVIFTGFRSDVASLLRGSDLLVLPSLREALGRVLLEAIAVGTPIVVSDDGGGAEIAGNDERGLRFRTGDAQSLAAQILQSLQNPELCAKRTAAGQGWVRETCDPDTHALNIGRLYDQLA